MTVRGDADARCPACRWWLRFTAEDRSWVARCHNQNCPADVVPPNWNRDLLAFVGRNGAVVSTDVAEAFGWSNSNAVNHLTALARIGLVRRRRIDPVRGGKRYEWSAA